VPIQGTAFQQGENFVGLRVATLSRMSSAADQRSRAAASSPSRDLCNVMPSPYRSLILRAGLCLDDIADSVLIVSAVPPTLHRRNLFSSCWWCRHVDGAGVVAQPAAGGVATKPVPDVNAVVAEVAAEWCQCGVANQDVVAVLAVEVVDRSAVDGVVAIVEQIQ
jgi:hypothetical protein